MDILSVQEGTAVDPHCAAATSRVLRRSRRHKAKRHRSFGYRSYRETNRRDKEKKRHCPDPVLLATTELSRVAPGCKFILCACKRGPQAVRRRGFHVYDLMHPMEVNRSKAFSGLRHPLQRESLTNQCTFYSEIFSHHQDTMSGAGMVSRARGR